MNRPQEGRYTLCRITSAADWWRVWRLYMRAFPATERKPFAIIRRMCRYGKTDVWVLRRDGAFAGFATTINGEGLILVDYLAVTQRLRGQGAGSAALTALAEAYAGCGIFVEIESPFEPGDDQRERLRRRAFYQRCGFEPCRTLAEVFGVPMELLGLRCRVDFAAYRAFYRTHYSEWAAEHIREISHCE